MDQLLKPQQVADIVVVPKATLYQWRAKGVGPRAVKVGRHLRYRESEVERWLDEQERQGAGTA